MQPSGTDDPAWRTQALSMLGFLGVVHVDFTTQRVRGDREAGRVFGVSPEQMSDGISLGTLERAFFDDDLDLIRRNRRIVAHKGGQVRLEYRLRDRERGGCIWIRSLAQFEADRDGRLIQASGALFDTTPLPPTAPSMHHTLDAERCRGEDRPMLPLAELDRLSGQLILASRSARSLGLSGIEADLRVTLGRVGALLSRRLRISTSH